MFSRYIFISAVVAGLIGCTGSVVNPEAKEERLGQSDPAGDDEGDEAGSRGDASYSLEDAAPAATRTRAPLPLRVELVEESLEGGIVELTASVTIQGRLPDQLTLEVDLLEPARLLEGQLYEQAETPAIGDSLTRRFVVDLPAGQIKVTASAVGPAGGAQAYAYYPPEVASPSGVRALPVGPKTREVPQVEFRGVKIDRAIPVERLDRRADD